MNESAGHLSVHVEGAHPVEVAFLFEQPEKRIAPAFAGSLVSHAAFGLLALFLVRYGSTASTTAALLPEQPNVNITQTIATYFGEAYGTEIDGYWAMAFTLLVISFIFICISRYMISRSAYQ